MIGTLHLSHHSPNHQGGERRGPPGRHAAGKMELRMYVDTAEGPQDRRNDDGQRSTSGITEVVGLGNSAGWKSQTKREILCCCLFVDGSLQPVDVVLQLQESRRIHEASKATERPVTSVHAVHWC